MRLHVPSRRVLATVGLVFALVLAGCAAGPGSDDIEENRTAAEIKSDALAATADVDTYEFSSNTSEVGFRIAPAQIQSDGMADIEAGEMYADTTLNFLGEQQLEVYLMGDTVYQYIHGVDDWQVGSNNETSGAATSDFLQSQLDLLEQSDVDLRETTELDDGTAVNALELSVAPEELMSETPTGNQTTQVGEYNITQYYGVEDDLIHRTELFMTVVNENGTTVGEFDQTTDFYAHNEPVDIELPADAPEP